MKIFKTDKYFLVSLCFVLAAFLFMLSVTLQIPYKFVAQPILIGVICLVLTLFIIYSLVVKIVMDEKEIIKKGVFGSVKIDISRIVDVTVLSMRGRYLFIIFTADNQLIFSSLYNDIKQILDNVGAKISDDAKKNIIKISEADLAGKRKNMVIFFAATFLLITGSSIYIMLTMII